MMAYIVMLIGLLLVYPFMFFFIYKLRTSIRKTNAQTNAVNISRQIMNKVQTNSTWPRLQVIFTQLDNSDKHCKMKYNTDFNGYFKNE